MFFKAHNWFHAALFVLDSAPPLENEDERGGSMGSGKGGLGRTGSTKPGFRQGIDAAVKIFDDHIWKDDKWNKEVHTLRMLSLADRS